MKCFLNEEDFNKLQTYVLSNSIAPNTDRCLIFSFEADNFIVCFNELQLSVKLCKNLDSDNSDDNYYNELLMRMIKAARDNVEIDNEEIKFYKEKIEPNIKCCTYNL